MALIQCRECNREISDQAPYCPHCGAPMSPSSPPPTDNNENNNASDIGISTFVYALILVYGLFLLFSGKAFFGLVFILIGGILIYPQIKPWLDKNRK